MAQYFFMQSIVNSGQEMKEALEIFINCAINVASTILSDAPAQDPPS
jgi:hypothetical protein